MEEIKIVIPGKKLKPREDSNTIVKLTPEAYNILVDLYNESAVSMRQLASTLIIEASKYVVFDRGE